MKSYILAIPFALISCCAGASCGTAYCSVNTHWDTQGLSNDAGLLIDLRYSYSKADILRAGTSRVAPAQPSGSDAEIENRRTINQLLSLNIDYPVNPRWNISVGVPLVMRDHAHTFDSSLTGPFTQQAKFSELGDVLVAGQYKFDPGRISSGSGIRFGLKLPTGAINHNMTPPDPADPATAYKLERSGQAGTGSTDAILGAYYYRNSPGADWGWFVSGQIQSALATRDSYRPGRGIALDLGLYHSISDSLNLLLQLNGQHRARDSGSNASPASGGYSLNLSPGLSYALSPHTRLYGLVQLPLRQYVNTDPADFSSGQLTAPWSMTVGVSHRF